MSGPVRQRIVDIVASRPHGVSREQLLLLVYGSDPNGGPSSPNVISVIIHQANRELRPQGHEIVARPGRGAFYRLVPVRPVRDGKRRYRQQNALAYVF